jgi:hemolysin activation/secretion protein
MNLDVVSQRFRSYVHWSSVRAFFISIATLWPLVANSAAIDPTGRSGEPPTLPQELPQPPRPGTVLPAVPPAPKAEPIPGLRVFVREIKVTGSTVFSRDELAKVTAPYVNREVTSEDLEALRVALTLLYVNNGYVNSGAILPDQTVTGGVINYQIIEGSLTGVEVHGNRWFRSSYFQKRFSLDAGPPLNINALQQRLQLLLEDSRIERLNAELRPGLARGEGILDVRVEDARPYRLSFEYNNYQSPSVGENRGIIVFEHQNVTGNGDVFTGQYGRSRGLNPLLDFKYSFPVTARDTILSYQYRKNTLSVIEQPFQDVDSKSDIYTLSVRHPIYRTLSNQVFFEFTGERLSLKTKLSGEDFSFDPGAQNGRTVVTALRPTLEWVYRSSSQVIATRSRFSFGIDALDATVNSGNLPDGKFFAWLGEFQWVRRLNFLDDPTNPSQFQQVLRRYGFFDSYLLFRTNAQLANNPLLSLEQISVGGRYSVRGYRENTMLRDQALITSFEARFPLIPLVQNSLGVDLANHGFDYLEFAPFYDFGRGWNNELGNPPPKDISSVGVGLRWAMTIPWGPPLQLPKITFRPQFEVYWGHRLRKVFNPHDSLQDNGVHLQFMLGLF